MPPGGCLPGTSNVVVEGIGHMEALHPLRASAIFRELDDAELRAFTEGLPTRSYPQGTVLVPGCAQPCRLWLLVSGQVRLARINVDGREVTIARCGPDSIVAAADDAEGSGAATVMTVETDALISEVGDRALRELVTRHPDVGIRLVAALGRRITQAEAVVEDLAFRSARERVARALLGLPGAAAGGAVRVSHADLARAAGVARETATKALGQLEDDGVVRTGYRVVRILDPAALAGFAADGSHPPAQALGLSG